MNDREKVIKGLDEITHYNGEQMLYNDIFIRGIADDALALLKEQKAVEPEQVDVYGEDEWWGMACVCPDCKTEWMCDKNATHFCPNCGRPVKWE